MRRRGLLGFRRYSALGWLLKNPIALAIVLLLLVAAAAVWIKQQIDEHRESERARERDWK